MRKHKVILEVEVYVEDGDDPKSCAEYVVGCLIDYIGHGGTSDPRVGDVRVVSVDKEPLPLTEDEKEDDAAWEGRKVAWAASAATLPVRCHHGSLLSENCTECDFETKMCIDGIRKRPVL